jgi:hypothetical protein
MSFTRRLTASGLLAAGATTFVVAATIAASAAPAAVAGVQGCNSNTKNWVALYPTWADWVLGRNASHCIGDRGTWDVPSNDTQVFCAGNNNGTVTYYDRRTEKTDEKSFSYDRSYSVVDGIWTGASNLGDSLDILRVTITGWTGSAGC